jgi:hypothetical protein
MEVPIALSQEHVEDLAAMKDMLEALETGKINIGNPWEGRTEAKIYDLRRKTAEHDLLIEKHDAQRS